MSTDEDTFDLISKNQNFYLELPSEKFKNNPKLESEFFKQME